jgi:hypothetical protein
VTRAVRFYRPNRIVRGKAETGGWNETNIFEHLKVRAPVHQRTYQTAFDWLCLMQHYSVPTRLLDWSEHVLPALYFAVRDDHDQPGELIILNARCLNVDSKLPSIFPPTEGQVVIRAEMSWTRRASKLRLKATVDTALVEENMGDSASGSEWLKRFRAPVAVFPSRLNDRMVFQASVFTLHGGKQYPDGMKQYYGSDAMPEPITLAQAVDDAPDLELVAAIARRDAGRKPGGIRISGSVREALACASSAAGPQDIVTASA